VSYNFRMWYREYCSGPLQRSEIRVQKISSRKHGVYESKGYYPSLLRLRSSTILSSTKSRTSASFQKKQITKLSIGMRNRKKEMSPSDGRQHHEISMRRNQIANDTIAYALNLEMQAF
jgi:hypothetical protein